jgi:hypothetical protein
MLGFLLKIERICYTFFQNWNFSWEFSLYIREEQRRISKTAMSGAGARSDPFCILISLNKPGARSARA